MSDEIGKDASMNRAMRGMGGTLAALLLCGCGASGLKTSAKPPAPPATYVCHRAPSSINLDGKLDDDAWKTAEWTSDFVDVRGQGWPKPHLRTRCKLLWDDTNLYIAAEMQDTDVWGTMTEKGSHLYEENNFEIFLDVANNARNYWEFEMNPLNTTWDLRLNRPLGEGGGPIAGQALAGLKTAVAVQGTVNNPADKDEGWTAEVIIPIKSLTDGRAIAVGEHCRIGTLPDPVEPVQERQKYERVTAGDRYWSWVPTGADRIPPGGKNTAKLRFRAGEHGPNATWKQNRGPAPPAFKTNPQRPETPSRHFRGSQIGQPNTPPENDKSHPRGQKLRAPISPLSVPK